MIHLISLPVWFSGAMFVSKTNCSEKAKAGKHSFSSNVIFCMILHVQTPYQTLNLSDGTSSKRNKCKEKKRLKSQNWTHPKKSQNWNQFISFIFVENHPTRDKQIWPRASTLKKNIGCHLVFWVIFGLLKAIDQSDLLYASGMLGPSTSILLG